MTCKRSNQSITLNYDLSVDDIEWCLLTKRVDEDTCNPLKVWHDLGEPSCPSKSQISLIKHAAQPFIKTSTRIASEDRIQFQLKLPENAVVYFELEAVHKKSDRGYDYVKVMQMN